MLEKKQVEGAVDAILALLKAKADSVSLVDHPKKIDLQFTLKQIPKLKHKNIHIDLPASIHYDLREVCVFVKDLDKKTREYDATVQHYEDLFSKHNIKTISKIVPLKALRTDYSLPSSKVSLAKAYDLYLTDSCVKGLLPGLLGKVFYAKKKTVPVKVNLNVKDLKKEIDRAVNNTRCEIQGSGSSCMVTVAHDRMDKDQIVSNVLAACKTLSHQVPGGKDNIRNIYVKSSDTTAVPLHIDIGSANDVKLPKGKPEILATYIDDVTTVQKGKVMIRSDGKVKVIRNKYSKDAVKAEEESDIKVKEEKIDETESQTLKKNSDDSSGPEMIESDDDKEMVQEEIKKNKKSGKGNKKQKKRKGKDVNEGSNGKDVEVIDSDNNNKDGVPVKIGKGKQSETVEKRQKKRKGDEKGEKDEDTPVEKKKVKKTEVVTGKQEEKKSNRNAKKLSKKGKKAKSG